MEGDHFFDFDDWRNFLVYWKGDFQYKETIKSFLSNGQWKKLRENIFGNFFRLQSVKFSGKLMHRVLLSEIVSNELDSMTFKVFDRDIKFTRDAFHIITGLKSYSSLDMKGLNEKENRLLRVYFPGKDKIELADLYSFISSRPHGTTSSFAGSDDDALKLATLYFVESVLMGKRKNRNVLEQIMKIVDDDALCASFNWGSLAYETLLKSLKSCLKSNENDVKKEKEKEKDIDSYTLVGFPFAFCVWIMEVLPIFQEKQFVNFKEVGYPRMLCYSEMKSPQFDALCRKYFHNKKLIEVSPFIPVEEEDTQPLCVEEPVSQDQGSMSSSTQFDEGVLKEIVRRLSESFKKDLQAEVTRVNQKIVVSEKKIENEIKDLKKTLGSKLDTLMNMFGKADQMNTDRESSVPIRKYGVDDHCRATERTGIFNQDAGGVERDYMDVHAEGQYEREFRDAHLDDETENVTDIGKEVCGVPEKICRVCGLQSQEDLTSPLGTSVSEIVCKCLEGTYDLSTPLSYKEKFGVQTCASQASEEAGVQYQEKTGLQSQDIGRSEIGSKSIDAICDDDDVAGMILDIANESCQQASKDHGEQLQDKENVELQEKENAARNILAELSLEKTQEGTAEKTGTDCALISICTIEILSFHLTYSSLKLKDFLGQIDLYADDNSLRKKPYKLYHQKISSKIFFLELSDSKFVLDDKHIDIALYYLRKKECYHPRDHPFRCTTTDVLFDNYMALVYKDFSEDASDEFCRRCGIAWTEVDKIFFPCRLPSEDDEVVTHFLLGVFDLNQKKIDVYDSIYSEPYEAGMNYMQIYARMIPHLLKFSQFDKNHKSFGNVFNKFDIQWQISPHQTGSTDCGAFLIKFVELLMIGKDVQQFQPEDIKDFRKELAANLWAHGEWKRNSGYDTPPENVGDDYESENETFCPKEL
ncbi:uncharacterized protein [Nicotiana sylvestris]|uniref:uncharacterized protein n=1 Tax=Nicotiana sylvestris TaxID=4096 RepID=UPI00388C5206